MHYILYHRERMSKKSATKEFGFSVSLSVPRKAKAHARTYTHAHTHTDDAAAAGKQWSNHLCRRLFIPADRFNKLGRFRSCAPFPYLPYSFFRRISRKVPRPREKERERAKKQKFLHTLFHPFITAGYVCRAKSISAGGCFASREDLKGEDGMRWKRGRWWCVAVSLSRCRPWRWEFNWRGFRFYRFGEAGSWGPAWTTVCVNGPACLAAWNPSLLTSFRFGAIRSLAFAPGDICSRKKLNGNKSVFWNSLWLRIDGNGSYEYNHCGTLINDESIKYSHEIGNKVDCWFSLLRIEVRL